MHQFYEPEFESFITFTCPICDSANQDVISVPRENWEGDTFEDRIAESEQTYTCSRCMIPLKLLVKNLGNRIVVNIIDYPEVKVIASQAYWSEEAEATGIAPWQIPETEPYNIFNDTMRDVLEVIQSSHADFFGKTLPRMAFVQQFSAVEAYLSDTLLRRVMEDDAVMHRMLAGVNDLRDIKLPLAEVLANPDIGKQTVAAKINKMMFHNFLKVDAIWNKAFGFSIFRDDGTRERILAFVKIRHDCVHRNGKSEDGKERAEVNFDFVREVAHYFELTVLHIEGQFEGESFVEDPDELA
jgi:hypothetical protein